MSRTVETHTVDVVVIAADDVMCVALKCVRVRGSRSVLSTETHTSIENRPTASKQTASYTFTH